MRDRWNRKWIAGIRLKNKIKYKPRTMRHSDLPGWKCFQTKLHYDLFQLILFCRISEPYFFLLWLPVYRYILFCAGCLRPVTHIGPKISFSSNIFFSLFFFILLAILPIVVDCAVREYDKKWYQSTIVSQEDWVCSKDMYQTNTFALNRIGEVIGTFFLGQLGDRWVYCDTFSIHFRLFISEIFIIPLILDFSHNRNGRKWIQKRYTTMCLFKIKLALKRISKMESKTQ